MSKTVEELEQELTDMAEKHKEWRHDHVRQRKGLLTQISMLEDMVDELTNELKQVKKINETLGAKPPK